MKNALIAIIVLLALVIGGGIFWYSTQQSSIVADPIDAIPTSAAIIISYPDITEAWDAFEDRDYYDVLAPIKELDVFFFRNQLLDSLIRYDQDLKTMLGNSAIWSSYHPSSTDSLLVFHAIQPSGKNENRVLKTIHKALSNQGVVTEQKVGEQLIYKLVFSEPFNVMYYTVKNGLILTSTEIGLLKESLAQMNRGNSLKEDQQFLNAIQAAGKNVEANLLISYDKLPLYLASVLKPTLRSTDGLIGRFASWTELDVNLKPEGIACNGFSYTADSLDQYLDLFLDQQPQTILFPDYLPSNTASFLFFGINDVINFSADYRKLLQHRGKLPELNAKLDSLNTEYGVDLEQNLIAWMGNTFGICITEPKGASFADHTYMVFEARSPDLATKLLSDLAGIFATKHELEIEVLESNGIKIQHLPFAGILTELLGDGLEAYDNPYYMIVGNHVIFGTTADALSDYLQYIQADRTLAKELSFSRFAENLGSTFNVFSYTQLAHSEQIFESYLNGKAIGTLQRNDQLFANFEAVGTQISTTGKSFYSNVYIKYNPKWQGSAETSWSAKLDAEPRTPPAFVKNHLSNQDEIIVQDDENALYLFNQMGQRLFKAELQEPIMSEIHQVDALKNGKLQYLFNTKNYIYLVDRNGNSLSGFPIELNSPAQTKLAVFDYDNDRNYRLLITCKNKRIYNYNIKGKKISGWNHNKASDPTIHQFKHLAVSNKDYLITGESNGKIHLLDRRGKNRLKVKKRVVSSNNQLQTFKSSEKAFTGVYLTDENGTINRISLNGDVSPMDLGKFSPEHHFIVKDLNKDGGPEFIFTDLNVLQVFNYKKEKVVEQRLDPSASAPFVLDLGEQGLAIGYCYKDSEQLVLFNSEGQMVDGFPVSGLSQFDLLVDGTELTVVSAGTDSELTIQSLR